MASPEDHVRRSIDAGEAALRRAARSTGRSEADLIREGIGLVTGTHRIAEPRLPLFVGRGVYRLEAFETDGIAAAERLIGRRADLDIGLADASIVVLAHRYGVRDLLTLDERHFRVLRGPGGRPFRLLPADTRLAQVDEGPG